MSESKKGLFEKLKEEFLFTTDTLWDNEVKANKFVMRILLITVVMTLTVLLLIYLNIFTVNSSSTVSTLLRSSIELLIAAFICKYFKGEKKWLKTILIIVYTVVLARITMLLGHNVVLLMVFPIILSIRYYSYTLTIFTGILTLISTIVAYAVGTLNGDIRLDLNMVEVPAGTTLTYLKDSLLREAVDSQLTLDYNQLWWHTLQHSLLPKILLFIMIIFISSQIARRGRMMIFDQQKETMKSERLATELNLAGDIQSSMLPNIFPAFPERKEFDVYASMVPAKEVGGDFYDFYLIDDDHLALLIADVSGKGIPAAMFMMASKIIINNYSLMGNYDPGSILSEANKRITSNNPSEMFVTVWLGILEISTGKVLASNGGHEYPYIYHSEKNKFEKLTDRHGLVLGAMDSSKYKTYEFKLEKGDALFVYTDGVPEATNKDNVQFGEERLVNSLNKNPQASAQELINNMKKDIDEFVLDAPQFDDTTMLAFRYNGSK